MKTIRTSLLHPFLSRSNIHIELKGFPAIVALENFTRSQIIQFVVFLTAGTTLEKVSAVPEANRTGHQITDRVNIREVECTPLIMA